MSTQEKIAKVVDSLEELKEVATHLDCIEKLMPTMDTSEYLKHRKNYRGMHWLQTTAEVHLGGGVEKIQPKSPAGLPLVQARSEHRSQVEALFELNNRIVNNLNSKLSLLQKKVAVRQK